MTHEQKLRCLAAVLCIFAVPHMRAQTQADSVPQGAAQKAKISPAFEVASVRPAHGMTVGFHVTPSGRFTATEPLLNLVVIAYVQKHGANVVGGPGWVESQELYEISAKVDDANMTGWEKLSELDRLERVRPMLRALLAERFHLKVAIEMKRTPIYALVPAKGGTKMKEVSPEELQSRLARSKEVPTERPLPGGSARIDDSWKGSAVPINRVVGLVQGLSGADRLVVDETGLKGMYDFTFRVPNDRDGATAAELIESGLGVKLEARTVPVETYVILSADKPSLD